MSLLPSPYPTHSPSPQLELLTAVRRWIDRLEVRSPRFAHLICRLIPCTCPFESRFTLLGQAFYVPPLCKLNPFYQEILALRLRALTYLADDRGEDVTKYIC